MEPSQSADNNPDLAISPNGIPNDVLRRIFSHLDKRSLCRVAMVCQHWLWVASDDQLWTHFDLDGSFEISEQQLISVVRTRFAPVLRCLNLSRCSLTPVMFTELVGSSHLLQTIALPGSKVLLDEHTVDEVEVLPGEASPLIRLDLRNCTNGYVLLHMAFEQADLSRLECFGYGRSESAFLCPSFSGFQSFVGRLSRLRVFDCIDTNLATDELMLHVASNCPRLVYVGLRKCTGVHGAFLTNLFRNCTSLKSLILRGTSIDDEHVITAPWNETELQELDLSDCHLSEQALVLILSQLPKLKYLLLNSCGSARSITDGLINRVGPVLSQLWCLSLRMNRLITGAGLAGLYGLSGLTSLSLRGCSQLSPTDIAVLVQYLPNLEVVELGRFFTVQPSDDWLNLLDALGAYCPRLSTCVLVSCSAGERCNITVWQACVLGFMHRCSSLAEVYLLQCDNTSERVFAETSSHLKNHNRHHVRILTDEDNLVVIPPPDLSLDAELARLKADFLRPFHW